MHIVKFFDMSGNNPPGMGWNTIQPKAKLKAIIQGAKITVNLSEKVAGFRIYKVMSYGTQSQRDVEVASYQPKGIVLKP